MAPGHPFLRRVHARILSGLGCCAVGIGISCFANPEGGVVVLGDALIQNATPGLTTIVQNSNRAVIDWQTFSIAAGERTDFIVPDASAATLNRVLGGGPSLLNGTLTSNGQLFLINSNGILFGQGSVVDVAGLTASALDVADSAFMAGGDMVFQGASEAAVRNAGLIRASSGDAILIGYQVENSGTLRAPNGTAALAAGSEVLIMPAGDERVVVRGATGSHQETGVSNSGIIEANIAELKAHGGNVYAMAIRNTGRVAATGVTRQGGRILLTATGGRISQGGSLVARGSSGNGGSVRLNAGRTGRVTVTGRVDADGPSGMGGDIAITGGEVEIRRAIAVTADGATAGGRIDIGADATETLIGGIVTADSRDGAGGVISLGGRRLVLEADALVSASGAAGGGRIDAGGGAGGLAASSSVVIDCGALLAANALDCGPGGEVVVMSADEIIFQGGVQARGGAAGGDGGQVLFSAGETLWIDRLAGRVDLMAAAGSAGALRVRSSEFVIDGSAAGVSNRDNFLDAADVSEFLNGASLTVQTKIGAQGGSGNIYVKDRVAWDSASALTLDADCDVLVPCGQLGAGFMEARGSGGVFISAARSVLLDEGTGIATTTGDVVITANQRLAPPTADSPGVTLAGDITTRGGNVSLRGTGVTSTGGSVDAGTGTITVAGGGGAVRLAGSLATTNDTSAAVRIVDAGAVSLGNVSSGTGGTVALGGEGADVISGPVTQTGAISAGTVTANTTSTVTLDGNNTVVNLGEFRSAGDFIFNDATDGLSLTGSIETGGGKAKITTAGGALALGANEVKTGGGNVDLKGEGVTSTGGVVDAGGGRIAVDGGGEEIRMAGMVLTTNESDAAVRIADASAATLGDVTTGPAGTVVLEGMRGPVTQTGRIRAGSLVLAGDGDFDLTNAANSLGTVTTQGRVGSLALVNSRDLAVGAGGLGSTGGVSVNAGANALTIGGDVISQGGAVSLTAAEIVVDGAQVSSSGGAAVRLTAERFSLVNQPVIGGVLAGAGGAAQLTVDDSNLDEGQSYRIDANTLTAGPLSYAFQNVASVRLDLGPGNDISDTNFFVFDQFLNAGGGTNQIFVGGSPVTTSPLTRPGFGTISVSGVPLSPAPPPPPPGPPPVTVVAPAVPPVGSVLLQNVAPPLLPGGGGSTQTNNFNSTSTAGVSSALGGGVSGGGGAAAAVAAGVAASSGLGGVISQNLGLASASGGAPPSFGVQNRLDSASSAATESELNLALGGDGTMGVRSSTGLVSVNPSGPPPSAGALALLEANMTLLALGELSFGAIGVAQVAVTSQFGAQSLILGGAPPAAGVRRTLDENSTPESYSRLYRTLGGDGTVRIDNAAGSVRVDLQELVVPPLTAARLGAIIMPGAFGELALVLGASGEYLVTPEYGLAVMDPAGTPAGGRVISALLAMLSVPAQSEASRAIGGLGLGILLPPDGIQSAAGDGVPPGAQVISLIEAAFTPESLQELDAAIR